MVFNLGLFRFSGFFFFLWFSVELFQIDASHHFWASLNCFFTFRCGNGFLFSNRCRNNSFFRSTFRNSRFWYSRCGQNRCSLRFLSFSNNGSCWLFSYNFLNICYRSGWFGSNNFGLGCNLYFGCFFNNRCLNNRRLWCNRRCNGNFFLHRRSCHSFLNNFYFDSFGNSRFFLFGFCSFLSLVFQLYMLGNILCGFIRLVFLKQ